MSFPSAPGAALLCLLSLLQGHCCYHWSPSLTNRAVKYACVGDDVTFPWAVTPSPGETVLTVQWNYQGRSDEIIAIFDSGLFAASPAFSERASHVSSEGISLSHVTAGDSGKYSILVTIRDVRGDKMTTWHLAELHIPDNCSDAQDKGCDSGVVTVVQAGHSPLGVFCDQDTAGGGWTVFQRRTNGSVDFYRTWAEYKNGFGSPEGEFWMGLDALHTLTSTQTHELRVDLEDWDGNKFFATYSNFSVSDSSDNYRLHFDSFKGGTAGDALAEHNGQQFSTHDVDHDALATNCAQEYRGAWWYVACFTASLNGQYVQGGVADYGRGLQWVSLKGYHYSLKASQMKIRPT